MRTVEVALGLAIMATAVALALGAGSYLALIPPPGLGITLALVGVGAAVATHGMAGRARAAQMANGQRWRSAFYIFLTMTVVATLPRVVDLFDLIHVAGFPLGYYMTAQGLLLFLAILAFRASLHLDAPDRMTEPGTAGRDR